MRIGLHDEYQVDAQLLDYLDDVPAAHRAQVLQRLLRVGFQVMHHNVTPEKAYQEACMPAPKGGAPRVSIAPVRVAERASRSVVVSESVTLLTTAPKAAVVSPAPLQAIQKETSAIASVPEAAPKIMHEPEPEELLDADPSALIEDEFLPDQDDLIYPPATAHTDAFARMRERAQE